MKMRVRIPLLLSAAAAFGIRQASFWVYQLTFYHDRKRHRNPEQLPVGEQYLPYRERTLALIRDITWRDYEEVRILSHDRLVLAGKYYHQRDHAPVHIMFHGYHSAAERDFCGGFHIAWNLGHNVLLIDQRAHGHSEGNTVTFGILERLDCLDWCQYALQRFGDDCKILLWGISMGASTVLMASGMTLPEQVRGIIADCSYDTPKNIIQNTAYHMSKPMKYLYPLAKLGARYFGHFDVEETSPVESVAHARVPILFIHGDDDLFVPYDMGVYNYMACSSEKYLLTVPKAGHCLSYLTDERRYTQKVEEFLTRVL